MKKCISCLLILLVLLMLPALGMETQAATWGTCGENLTWTLNAGTLTISGSGAMYSFEYPDDQPWYSQRDSILSVVVGEGVARIGDCAFYGCTNLSSVTIPGSVTRIGGSAFQFCTSLSSITIPDSVTRIGDYAFYDCTSLSSVMIPDSVISIGEYTFCGCTSMSGITIPKSVTGIGIGALNWCTGLTGIWVDNENPMYSCDDRGVLFDKGKSLLVKAPGAISGVYSIPETVTDIGIWAFLDCPNLTNVTIPNSVTSIGVGAFAYCTGLGGITLSDSVTGIGDNIFYDCKNITCITIPDSVTYIDNGAFSGCTNLRSITIPESVTYIYNDAFNDCISLTTVHYGGTEDQRANIRIFDENWDLEDAVWHYECTEGNCPSPFVDIATSAYYYDPVLWAVDQNITKGTSAITFAPDATCTRGQIVTFLWRACGSPEPTSSSNPFWDVSSSDYFYKAVLWAVENGITSGMGDGSFAPGAPCTRGQVATFLWRACGQPAPSGTNIFTDIAPGAYYYDAVLWAVENGITNGMGDGTFAPDAPCTRGQIVTFLYRAMA